MGETLFFFKNSHCSALLGSAVLYILIASNTYKLRVIAGKIKLHLFPQIFTMTGFHAKISK
jgi:hypothetical protein